MKERSIKELLELMLKYRQLYCRGLCHFANILHLQDIISFQEMVILRIYIKDNRPSMFSSFEAFAFRITNYYWKPENIVPRIKWIKKHIKKNS